ncbi:MAG: MarR family transcriptional regulator [Clostridia bacterium]|nr:MarR family transcriptional regulator [Clostridia bacterium]
MEKEKRISFQLHYTSRLIKRLLDKSKNKDFIQSTTGNHGHIIGFIYDKGEKDVFQKDIEKEFNIRRSTATNMLKLMEKNGLITRSSVAEDARLKKISLTKKALEVQKFVEEDFSLLEEKLSENISPEELETFFSVLSKINKNVLEVDDHA